MQSVTRWVAFVSVGVGVGASQRIPLSILAWNPHKGLAREISYKTGRRRGRSQKRRNQSTEQGSRQKLEEADGRERWLLGPADPEVRLANVREWVSFPNDFVGILLEYMRAIAHRRTECLESVTNFSFLRLELTQVRACLFSFLPLGCVCCALCVRKEMWNTPGWRWEKPLDDLMAMSSLGGWDSGDRPAVYCHRRIRSWLLVFDSINYK